MKTWNRTLWLALLLLVATPLPAEEAGWWATPYPDRFDGARLERPQAAISISGNAFVTADGKPFVFRGVNVGDPDKLARQGRWNENLFEEIRAWGANCVRLPIHPAGWRDKGADWYFARLDEAVRWANRRGLYLVIDWHSIGNLDRELFQHPMYRTSPVETSRFWRAIAHRYRGVPTLAVYELFNEPTDDYIGTGPGSLGKASWEEWRVTMEDLIDLVRTYDSDALPLVAGFNWAYDLGPVADQPIRRDRVAYAVHAYPQKALPASGDKAGQFELWQRQWGHLADTYPLFASEIGWVREDGYNAHVPVIDNSGGYGPMLVEFMEARGVSWAVWNFDPDWAPTMISDWDFTPTEQGRFFRYVMRRLSEGSLPMSVLPSPRLTEWPWMSIARWREFWNEDLQVAAGQDVDVLLLGDSITEMWPEATLPERLPGRTLANFGIGGDRTENLLWRLQNGAAGQLKPAVVVIMIGVNNFLHRSDSPEDVYAGVAADVAETRARFPDARVVLLGILPYGEQAGTPERQQVAAANRLIAGLAQDPQVEFHDIGAAFLQPDGTISAEIMADFLHPTPAGYEVFADQLQPILKPLLR